MIDEIIQWIRNGDIKSLTKLYHLMKDDINKVLIHDDDCDMNILHIISGLDSIYRDQVITHLLTFPGLDINRASGPGNDCYTAAHIVSCKGFSNSLNILLKHGADPYLHDINKNNVWDIASAYDHFPCIVILENHFKNSFNSCQYTSFSSLMTETSLQDENSTTYYSFLSNSSQDTIIHVDSLLNLTLIETSSPSTIEYMTENEKSIEKSIIEIDGDTFTKLSNTDIRHQLIEMGENPGPITDSTRSLYLNRLKHLKSKSDLISEKPKPLPLDYDIHINNIITDIFNFNEAEELEKNFISYFETRFKPKNFFTYLLLDPRITQNLPEQKRKMNKSSGKLFQQFIKSIFYIGKGQGNRPFMHLYEAALVYDNHKILNNSNKKKIEKIIEIWKSNLGVISVHCFHGISSEEAFVRESLMIDAIGIEKLTNIRIGHTFKDLLWTTHKKSMFGTLLLYKAFNILINNGERQVRKADLS